MPNIKTVNSWDGMTWLNPPAHHAVDASGTLSITTGDKTDFWQSTFYGFHRDDGHILAQGLEGPFTIAVDFEGDYQTLYDQAGLIIRVSATSWIKCGLELTDGQPHFSVVVTNGKSDWSAIPVEPSGPVSVRITRLKDAFFIQFRLTENGDWRMARLAYLTDLSAGLTGGIMACSPQRAGFVARFSNFSITPPVISDIH
jgi:uncharacterized protein